MTDRHYLALLYSFTNFGPARTKLLVSYFGSSQKAWCADKDELSKIGLNPKTLNSFLDYRENLDRDLYFANLKKYDLDFVTIDEPDYPQNLKDLENGPLVLYYKGVLKKSDVNAVAIIGSRKMTSYGREVAYKFASELAGMGIAIVSGLALGIDAVAHKACIEAGGRGIIVLASGLDTVSPLQNKWIADAVVKKGGVIFSEYPIGYKPFKTSFPVRNRIVSGLSKAVLVVEGARKSGTLLTASSAAEQGRTVFAVPGQVFSPLSEAPHYLLQNGAKLATKASDILEELDMDLRVNREVVERVMPVGAGEAKLIEILSREVLHIDDMGRILGLTAGELSATLTVMELKGLIRNLGGGMYKKV